MLEGCPVNTTLLIALHLINKPNGISAELSIRTDVSAVQSANAPIS